jgi:penicillin-binding protein 1A
VGFDDFARDLGKTSYNNNLGKEQTFGGEFGAKTAQPAWIEFMREVALSAPVDVTPKPLNISTARIDLASGLLTKKTDYTTRFEYFNNGSVPTEYVQSETFSEDINNKENQQDQHNDELF